jgi:hypothetical protein
MKCGPDLWIAGDVPGALNLSNPTHLTIGFAKGRVDGV